MQILLMFFSRLKKSTCQGPCVLCVKTSLKSQKFTWQPAAVCISFTKSKNILTIFNYIDLIISFFIFHIQEFHDFILFYSKIWMIYLWFFMFYQWFWWILMNFDEFFKIFHVLFKILNNFLLYYYFIHKVFMFYQWFWWFLKIFHELFKIFMIFMGFFYILFFSTILPWFSHVFNHTIIIASTLHHIWKCAHFQQEQQCLVLL